MSEPTPFADTVRTLEWAFDVLSLVENYPQPDHVWPQIRNVKLAIIDTLRQFDGEEIAPHEHVYRCQDCGEIGRGPAHIDGDVGARDI